MLERPQTHDPETGLLRRCRDWPLLLDAANAWLLGEQSPAERADAARDLLDVFDSVLGPGVGVVDAAPDDRRWAIGVFLDGTIDRLGDTHRERLFDLALFPDDVPTSLLAELWRTSVADVALTCRRLQRNAVFQRADLSARGGTVRLDATVRDHLRSRPDVAPDLPARHRRLLDAVRPPSGDWADLATGNTEGSAPWAAHVWNHLDGHLLGAGDGETLAATVRSADWLAGLNAVAGPAGVERVLDRAPATAGPLVAMWRRDAWTLAQLDDRRLVAGALTAWEGVVTPTRGLRLRHHWPAPDDPSEQLLRTLAGRTGTVPSVAWSPDGARVAGGTSDGEVVIWDPDTGVEQVTLAGHLDAVAALAWSPDGDRVLTGGEDGTVRLWDPTTGVETGRFERFTGPVLTVAWSPDGALAATGGWDGTVRVWDPVAGVEIGDLAPGSGRIRSVAWCPGEVALAIGCEDGTVAIWDAASGAATVRTAIRTGPVTSVAWDQDGTSLAVGCGDGTVVVWNPDGTDPPVRHDTRSGAVSSVTWSIDATHLATVTEDEVVRVWSLDGWDEVVRVGGRPGWMLSAAWSPDGVVLATGGVDGTVRIWDPAADGGQVEEPATDTPACSTVVWSPDGSRLAVAGSSGVAWWPAGAGPGDAVIVVDRRADTVAWSPDGSHLAVGAGDGTVGIVGAATGTPTLTRTDHESEVTALAWSAAGGLVSAAADGTVVVHPAPGDGDGHGDDLGVYRVDLPDRVRSVAWSPDGTRIAVGDDAGAVHLFTPGKSGVLDPFRCGTAEVSAVAWSPDGALLATASGDGTIRVLDPAGWMLLARLDGHTAEVDGIAWSPDGSHLASVSGDRTLRIWDPTAGTALTAVAANGSLSGVAWSGTGNLIAVAGRLGTYLLSVVDGADAVADPRPGTTGPVLAR